MATIALTEADFGETITNNGIVFVDFWAAWCGPCRMFGPVFEALSETHPDAVFAKVDTDAERNLAGGLGISSIPTLMAFRDGYLVYREAGALNKNQFGQLVDQVKALDMEKLKAEAAAANNS
jgi:thioredoxin 1